MLDDAGTRLERCWNSLKKKLDKEKGYSMERPMRGDAIFWICLMPMCLVLLLMTIMMMMLSCTISFQNVSTNGYADDLIDENQDAKADVSAQVEGVPIP